jgi:hypothetical protein
MDGAVVPVRLRLSVCRSHYHRFAVLGLLQASEGLAPLESRTVTGPRVRFQRPRGPLGRIEGTLRPREP